MLYNTFKEVLILRIAVEPSGSLAIRLNFILCFYLGCLGCVPQEDSVTVPPLSSRMALISGTSTCHMAVSWF